MEIVCENCGETAERRRCRVEQAEYNFCSLECHNEHQKERFSGEGNPNYEGAEYTCINCGEVNQATPSTAKRASYCDKECMAKHFSERMSGEGNPMWNGGLEEIECEWCGDTAEFVPAEAEVRRFCCDSCYKSWLSDHRQGDAWVGEDNPAWAGGEERNRFYGPNWKGQREAALDRDDHQCVRCGDTDDLNVHHKVPIRNFDRDLANWYERANALDNLVTLCRPCHMHIHAHEEDYLFDFIG